jgi:LmbE family N-acetylglucosaminyl deacetylase
MRGRKPKHESRSGEFRRRLIAWMQTPESSRPSLRALACELGTSHQLLTFYLKRLEKWKGEEYWRQAREIRARAKPENRVLTPWEEQQAHAYDRAAIRTTIASMLLDEIQRMKEESERGPLCWQQIKALKIFAREFPEAQELLQKCSQSSVKNQKNNLPSIPSGAAKPFRRA